MTSEGVDYQKKEGKGRGGGLREEMVIVTIFGGRKFENNCN